MRTKAHMKGKYTPVNPEKYLGDVSKIVYRSSYEYEVFRFCDLNPNVLAWASEEIAIPYLKPSIDGQMVPARYYPDVYVEYQTREGSVRRELIEIKPKKQTRPSKSRSPKTRLVENATFMVNVAKWEAAERWASERGIEFKLMVEDDIFRKKI